MSGKFNNLYVKNFPSPDFNEQDLERFFGKWGEITSAVIMKNEDGTSKGFGFVCYVSSAVAMTVNGLMKSTEISMGMTACEAKSKEQREEEAYKRNFNFKKSMMPFNLFVKGLEPGTTQDEIESFFGDFGALRKVKFLPDAGRAFVCYHEREGAQKAKDDGKKKPFKGKHLYITTCEPKELRAATLEE